MLIGLSGISVVIQKLKQSHESSTRIVACMCLEPLTLDESKEVVRKGLEESRSRGRDVDIKPDALEWIARLPEGFPHFIQQYAFSAFETDANDIIELEDVHVGAYKERGALDQLGANYFEGMYLDQINSDEYRTVLRVMAESSDEYLSRKQISKISGLKETTLGNALSTLKEKGIIMAHREKRGFYKLPNNSFAAWIRARSQREQENKQQKKLEFPRENLGS